MLYICMEQKQNIMTAVTKDSSNKEELNFLVENLGLKNFSMFTADKHFSTYGEFICSKELKEVHSGFQSWTSIKENMFIEAWVIGTDVYVHYKADGIKFIKKESISSCLSSGGLYYALPVEFGFITLKDECFKKCESNRVIWRKQDWRTLTEVA